jgi:hypothetical protein
VDLLEVFRAKAQHLFWQRLDDSKVVGSPKAKAIEKDQAYFVVRLREMYVRYSRKLWRKLYPVLHAYTKHLQGEEYAVAGPGHLRELGDSSLDRVVNLNHRLAGPTPYRGDEVSLLVGLYSVPAEDAVKALVKTVGDLASLGGLSLGLVPQMAEVLKGGVENILGLGSARLQMGVRDAFFRDNPLRSGVYLGVSAPAGDVQGVLGQLWVRDGRLVRGADPSKAVPYEGHDYMVLAVERQERRDDWPGLPGIAEHEAGFARLLADGHLTAEEKRTRLGELWGPFRQALASSQHLTAADRENIAGDVAAGLRRRLEQQNPFFEQRGAERAAFDFVDVAESTDRLDADSLQLARSALAGNPFHQ